MDSLRKSLQEYFKYLEKHDVIIGELIKRAENPIGALKNFSEQVRHVRRADIKDMPIGRIPDIKEKLVFKISVVMEDEVGAIQKIIEDCKNANDLLEKKLFDVQKCLTNVGDLSTLSERDAVCRGSSSCASIMQMIEWAEDSWRLYHAIYLKFCNYVVIIQSGDEKKISEFGKYDLYPEELKPFLERVVATTQSFMKNS